VNDSFEGAEYDLSIELNSSKIYALIFRQDFKNTYDFLCIHSTKHAPPLISISSCEIINELQIVISEQHLLSSPELLKFFLV
jgi:hypothetical protein